ncbi:hypothetical protein PAXINDRAFT_10146 [Paxillus involutus ATCC 200175]|nr:hypothetical protein PAXINDRAFT_10146 [Paxillus involutus ATCC 200175]
MTQTTGTRKPWSHEYSGSHAAMEQMQQQWLGQPAYASNAVKTGMMRQGGQGDGNITRQGDGNTIRQGDSDTTRHWGNENDMPTPPTIIHS